MFSLRPWRIVETDEVGDCPAGYGGQKETEPGNGRGVAPAK